MSLFAEIIDVLLENSPNDQRDTSEDKVEKRYVHIFEQSLAGVAAVEGEDELGEGEQHVFVEEVEDHLCDSHVVPPAMH